MSEWVSEWVSEGVRECSEWSEQEHSCLSYPEQERKPAGRQLEVVHNNVAAPAIKVDKVARVVDVAGDLLQHRVQAHVQPRPK